ncbi:MAG: alpha-L-fucosidase [Opitutaceae bacterium]
MTIKNIAIVGLLGALSFHAVHAETGMDELWGESVVKLRAEDAKRGQLFDEGNYAMFIHWGLYSQLGNNVDGKTYYGIGEWIMSPRMAGIPVDEYKELAGTFNPVKFDAKAIAKLAYDAGMKYIIITSKHHDGFAMYDSKSSDFDITDSTPWGRDPMKELSEACREFGIGFGFYYSHNQDWTYPGGFRGPEKDKKGKRKTFDDYFIEKCLPQVEEITTEYGPIEIVWFDTPGNMPKKYVEQLVAVVHKNQPNALVSGRAGHNLGDYQSLGDMEVPLVKVPGMWESVDTTNDSWAYAWYDENWKPAKEILHRTIATVARGGTYMLNIGPRGDGSVPEHAADALRKSGAWIKKYPNIIYGAGPSPYEHALPWGDVTLRGNTLQLSVFEWPTSGELYLPGLKNEVTAARLLTGKDAQPLEFTSKDGWLQISIPLVAPEKYVSVIELDVVDTPKADSTWGLDPNMTTSIRANFATSKGAKLQNNRWMEKFGEWKHMKQVIDWQEGGIATWVVDVAVSGTYHIDLSYLGEGRVVWQVAIEGGETIRNQQASSSVYHKYPIGWMNFPEAGRYTINVSCIEGDTEAAGLSEIHFTRVQ